MTSPSAAPQPPHARVARVDRRRLGTAVVLAVLLL